MSELQREIDQLRGLAAQLKIQLEIGDGPLQIERYCEHLGVSVDEYRTMQRFDDFDFLNK